MGASGFGCLPSKMGNKMPSYDGFCDECGDQADMFSPMYCLCFACFDCGFQENEDDWFDCNAEQPDS